MSVTSTCSIAPALVERNTARRFTQPFRREVPPALPVKPKEHVFLESALAGNQEAIEGLLAFFRPRLYRVALRLLRSREDAEDAVQDALFSAYRNLASFEGRSLFSTWLTRILVNAALVQRRRRRCHPELFIDDAPSSESHAVPMGIVDSHPDPEQYCACNETRAVVEAAMKDLAPAMRLAFQLVDLDDLSNADAARASGVRVGAFKSRICRARTQLAARLEPSAIAPLQKYIPSASSRTNVFSADDGR